MLLETHSFGKCRALIDRAETHAMQFTFGYNKWTDVLGVKSRSQDFTGKHDLFRRHLGLARASEGRRGGVQETDSQGVRKSSQTSGRQDGSGGARRHLGAGGRREDGGRQGGGDGQKPSGDRRRGTSIKPRKRGPRSKPQLSSPRGQAVQQVGLSPPALHASVDTQAILSLERVSVQNGC
jgi:hypothetical protein